MKASFLYKRLLRLAEFVVGRQRFRVGERVRDTRPGSDTLWTVREPISPRGLYVVECFIGGTYHAVRAFYPQELRRA